MRKNWKWVKFGGNHPPPTPTPTPHPTPARKLEKYSVYKTSHKKTKRGERGGMKIKQSVTEPYMQKSILSISSYQIQQFINEVGKQSSINVIQCSSEKGYIQTKSCEWIVWFCNVVFIVTLEALSLIDTSCLTFSDATGSLLGTNSFMVCYLFKMQQLFPGLLFTCHFICNKLYMFASRISGPSGIKTYISKNVVDWFFTDLSDTSGKKSFAHAKKFWRRSCLPFQQQPNTL